jgi:hypothetical protein
MIMNLFKKLMLESATVALIVGVTAACPSTPEPKKTVYPSKSPTDENGREIKQPIPTGCKGKIVSRRYDEQSHTFAITYNDERCDPSRLEIISEEQDLNATCHEGDYFPICLTPDQTEPPGIRQPTSPAS